MVVVTPPWNFPLVHPRRRRARRAGRGQRGASSSPRREAVLVGWHLAQALWDGRHPAGGAPVRARVPTTRSAGRSSRDPRVDAVILTGSAETARLFLEWRPDLRLFAETSGKNA